MEHVKLDAPFNLGPLTLKHLEHLELKALQPWHPSTFHLGAWTNLILGTLQPSTLELGPTWSLKHLILGTLQPYFPVTSCVSNPISSPAGTSQSSRIK
jgi:hypothetical protein